MTLDEGRKESLGATWICGVRDELVLKVQLRYKMREVQKMSLASFYTHFALRYDLLGADGVVADVSHMALEPPYQEISSDDQVLVFKLIPAAHDPEFSSAKRSVRAGDTFQVHGYYCNDVGDTVSRDRSTMFKVINAEIDTRPGR